MAALRKLRHNDDGVTIVEFAFVAPAMILLLTGLLEMGYVLFARSTLESAVLDASREARVSTCPTDIADGLRQRLKDRMSVIMSSDGNGATLEVDSYSGAFGNVGNPEPFDDTNNNGVRDEGESYTDVNGNGTWDTDMAVKGSFGGAGDIVRLTGSQKIPSLFPYFAKQVTGGRDHYTVTSVTVIRNEPFQEAECS